MTPSPRPIAPEHGPATRRGGPPGTWRGDLPAAGADVLAVLGFVLLGRTSHQEGGAIAGFVRTAWPFLAGTATGWLALVLLARTGRELPARSLRAGSVVLAATVVVGMALRGSVTGKGTPVSFLVVATVFLAVFLLGWRSLHRLRRRQAGS